MIMIRMIQTAIFVLIGNASLALYNIDAYYKETGSWGLGVFVATVIFVSLYLLYVIFNPIKNKRFQVQISTYFFITGLSQILILIGKYYRGSLGEYTDKSNFWMFYIGLFLLGLLLLYGYKIVSLLKNHKGFRREISWIPIILTVLSQLYLINPSKANDILINTQPVKAIINILAAGPKVN